MRPSRLCCHPGCHPTLTKVPQGVRLREAASECLSLDHAADIAQGMNEPLAPASGREGRGGLHLAALYGISEEQRCGERLALPRSERYMALESIVS